MGENFFSMGWLTEKCETCGSACCTTIIGHAVGSTVGRCRALTLFLHLFIIILIGYHFKDLNGAGFFRFTQDMAKISCVLITLSIINGAWRLYELSILKLLPISRIDFICFYFYIVWNFIAGLGCFLATFINFNGTSVVKWGIIISALLWIAIFPPLILVKELKRTKFGSQSSQNFDSIPSPSGIPVPDSFLNQPASTSLVVTIT